MHDGQSIFGFLHEEEEEDVLSLQQSTYPVSI
jgi:hypothetical protein